MKNESDKNRDFDILKSNYLPNFVFCNLHYTFFIHFFAA